MEIDKILQDNILTPKMSCHIVKANAYQCDCTDMGSFVYAVLKDYPTDSRNFFNGGLLGYTSLFADEIEVCRKDYNDLGNLMSFLKFAEGALTNDRTFTVDEILRYVKKNGFPFTQIAETNIGYVLGFSVDEFLNRIDDLYIRYAVWQALQIEDDSLIKCVKNYAKMSSKQMQEFISRKSNTITHICIEYIDNAPSLRYEVENKLALAEAQLSYLISRGNNYLQGATIAFCADCGSPYVKYRKNSTLCDCCKGNTGKSRRYRAKKKRTVAESNS